LILRPGGMFATRELGAILLAKGKQRRASEGE
jgi:hypothetical protein